MALSWHAAVSSPQHDENTAFFPVFPSTESIAEAFCRFFLWNFKEKSICRFLWHSLSLPRRRRAEARLPQRGDAVFLGFTFRIRGKGGGKVWMRCLLCRKAAKRAWRAVSLLYRHRRAAAPGASQGVMMGGLEAIVAGGRARVPHGMERGRQRLP